MAFLTVHCPDTKCRGVIVLGIEEQGSIFAQGKKFRTVKQGIVELRCPECEKNITVTFEHVRQWK